MIDQPIVVVGAGAGGLPAAVGLAEAGLPVILMERGRAIEPERYPTDRYDYEVQPHLWDDGSETWQGAVKPQRALGLGGSTLCFQALSSSPSDRTLENWGLPLGAIQESIREVVEFLQVAGEIQPSHPLNPVSTHLLAAAHRLHWRCGPTTVAILSQPHGGRPACNHCGLCVFGCRIGDKASADRTWLPRLRNCANATVLTETRVDRLVLSSASQVGALEVTGPYGAYRQPVHSVLLAAGALETPRLLKSSRQPLAPAGIGNHNVGHYLTSSLWQSLLVSVPHVRGGAQAGIPIDIAVHEFEEQGIRLYQGRNLAGIRGPISAARYFVRERRGLGIRPWMQQHYARLAGLGGYAESSTRYEDALADGPVPRFTKTLQDSDHRQLTEMSRLLHQWGDAAGVEVLGEYGSAKHGISGAMIRGTCRMGMDPATSATGPDGRMHGYDNLVISDASMLGAGLISDPSLVLQALGLHRGRELAARLRAL